MDDPNNKTFQNNDSNENINTEFINTDKERPENENNNNTHISTATISNITSSISECALQQIKLLHQQLEDKDVEIKKMKQRLENAEKVLCRCEKSKKILMNRRRLSKNRIENIIIKTYLPYIKQINCDIVKFFITNMENIKCYTLKNCHGLFDKIKTHFIKFKLRKSCQSERLNKPVFMFNSKTMAMHSLIK